MAVVLELYSKEQALPSDCTEETTLDYRSIALEHYNPIISRLCKWFGGVTIHHWCTWCLLYGFSLVPTLCSTVSPADVDA
jgi:hypothetical protein